MTPRAAGEPTRLPHVLAVALVVEAMPCLVVGGGASAARRATDLLDGGATVTVVAEDPGRGVEALAVAGHRGTIGPLRLLRRAFEPSDCTGQRLVFVASGATADAELVGAAARRAGALVHVEDTPARCDFYLPAVHRDGPVVLAVSTSGASPALARWLRDRLARELGEDLGAFALAVRRRRDALHARGRSTEGLAWDELLDEQLAVLLRDGDLDAVEARLDAWAEGLA